MSKEFAYEAYDNLKSSLDLKIIFSNNDLEKIINKNYILSSYTIWETYAKKKIYDTYVDYEYLLHTDDFIRRYLKKSFGKTYLSNIFLEDLKDTKVKKEILCQSNNLRWPEFEEMLSIIGFDKTHLEKQINESEKLKKIIHVLKAHNIFPRQDKIRTTSIYDSVKGYIAYITELRNTISHTYKMEIDEYLSNKQMIILIDFFKVVISNIEEYFEKELEKLFLDLDISKENINVLKVIKGCNSTGNDTAILEIILTEDDVDDVDLTNKKWVIKSSTNKGYAFIEEIKTNGFNLKKLPYNKVCTISIRPTIKIKRSTNYVLSSSLYKYNQGSNILYYNDISRD